MVQFGLSVVTYLGTFLEKLPDSQAPKTLPTVLKEFLLVDSIQAMWLRIEENLKQCFQFVKYKN
jgi:hypothetical protein